MRPSTWASMVRSSIGYLKSLIEAFKIQRYVEILDQYFGSVCELDIIFNFEKAHFVWNELVVGGELMESSKREVLEAILDQDDIQSVFF